MMLDIKMYTLPLIWLESWNHTIEGMIEVNSEKNRSNLYHVRYFLWLDWSKMAKHLSVNLHEKFLSLPEANRQASKWILVSLSLTFFSFLGSYLSEICCTLHLGQMFIRFLTITFDFYWSLALRFSYIMVSFRQHVSFSIT